MRPQTKTTKKRIFGQCITALLSALCFNTYAQDSDVSPARNISRDVLTPQPPPIPPAPISGEYRSFDGSHNNLSDPLMGAAHTQLTRLATSTYDDSISSIADDGRPNVRSVSVAFSNLNVETLSRGPSDFMWQWGQFLDHDLSLSEGIFPAEPEPINIPSGDTWFDPDASGNKTMAFNRTIYDLETGTSSSNPRQQLNEITAWIDASNVYGSDETRASYLRLNDGSGKLKTSHGNYLPKNLDGLANAGGDSDELFIAGDVRANEQLGLLSMHTLFVREHNRLVDVFSSEYTTLDGETLYQKARKVVAGQMQKITYNEYLPTLLGSRPFANYKGYDENIDASLSNEFTTALYRYGHSLVSPKLLRIEADGSESGFGHLALRDAFFAPYKLAQTDIDPILRGLAAQPSQKIDLQITSELSNFLFGQPGQGGFDLVSLNIQRGRDHGLATYNQTRLALGLSPASTMEDISSNPEIVDRLNNLYTSVDDVDLWVGALAEDTYKGMVGELTYHGLKEQFEKLRDGDRFWYLLDLDARERRELTRLAEIIKRNTNIGGELSRNVFYVR